MKFRLPQLALGRLVENPAEIVTAVDQFLAQPSLTPNSALVSGYDFLLDSARDISATLRANGVTDIIGPIDNN